MPYPLPPGTRGSIRSADLEGVDTVQQQIAIAKEKAGIPPQIRPDLYRFTVTRYK